VPPCARDGFATLVANPRMQQSAGFWLRHDEQDRIDQVDLALPWLPPAHSLAGLERLIGDFDLAPDQHAILTGLPVRHIAVRTDPNLEPAVTLYLSATLPAPPASETALQSAVAEAAREAGARTRLWMALLPDLPPVEAARGSLDRFYSGDIDSWRSVLGEAMHYHHGLFDTPDPDPDDAAMLAASRRAVEELYPFIAPGSTVYDIGCGWGGPLGMLATERGCRALGVTIGRTQFRYIAGLGLPVRWADAERTLPPGRFDTALLLESFEHMEDKPRLLRVLRAFCGRLVMRMNCQDAAPPGPRFGGTMHMITSAMLRAMLTETGWKVRHWRDCRTAAMPSVAVWHRRLQALGPTYDLHLETQRTWCDRLMRVGAAWAANNPLIEVVAD
jgi:hypothetical protein